MMSALVLSSVVYEFLKKLVYGKTGNVVVIAALVFLLLGWNIASVSSKVMEWFGGKDVPTLKAEVALKDETIKGLVAANKEKDSLVETAGVLHQNEVDTLVDVVRVEKKVDRKVTEIKTRKKERVQAIATSASTEEQKVIQESIVLVESLWEAYCEVEPNCKKEVKS